MLKYLYGFKLRLLNSVNYRFNTVVDLIFRNISVYITILFWFIVYKNQTNKVINNYSINDIITYFIMSGIFTKFVLGNAGFDVNSYIKEGMLNTILIKPYNYTMVNYFNNLSVGIGKMIPQLIFTLIIMLFFSDYMTCNINFTNMIFLIVFLIIASITSYLVWTILGYLAFWIDEACPVMWSFAVLFSFIAGNYIPLDFFPKWLKYTIEFLPFSNWGYIPIKVYLGMYDINKLLTLLLVNFIWVIILIIVERTVWNKGIKRYSSVGG